jgi:hypothetical protein
VVHARIDRSGHLAGYMLVIDTASGRLDAPLV